MCCNFSVASYIQNKIILFLILLPSSAEKVLFIVKQCQKHILVFETARKN